MRLGPGIYSARPLTPAEEVVRRNWAQILDHELPGAIITDRSARRGAPADGLLTVVHRRKRPLHLPGLTISPRRGVGALPTDIPVASYWQASQARGLLENLRGRGERYLSRTEIETWIADLLASGGERQLNYVRDRARELAAMTGWSKQFHELDGIIGATLATQPAKALQTESLRSRAAGKPFDHQRLSLFEGLVGQLLDTPPEPLPVASADSARRRLLPFYEAYFSNYIEGTEFTLDEAAAIVFEGDIPPGRPEDAHDVLGTYQIVSDDIEMRRIPSDVDDLLDLLKSRHRHLMQARPDKRPGQFKERANRAGSTVFVEPALVAETLHRAFVAGQVLVDPFARGVYVGFVVAEVHPFDDGNGRISRMMINADLSHAGEGRLIIPTVYRNNYLAALRGASHNANFGSLVATLRFAQRYTARIDFSSRETAEAELAQTNALRDPNEADALGVRLVMPT